MIQFAETEITFTPDFEWRLLQEARARMPGAALAAAHHLRTKVIERLSGQRSGREYFVPGARSATYRASQPDEAPASATGKLRQNVNVEGPVVSADEVGAAVGVDGARVPYARRLELGGVHVQAETQPVRTPNGWITVKAGTVIRIAPRPYLRPTFMQERETVLAIMQAAVNRLERFER